MKLFEPFKLGPYQLMNRMVLAPMTRSRTGKSRIPNALMAEYYAQRANAGLLISEATSISVQGLGWNDSPGIYTDEQADAWQLITKAVHDKDGEIFLQLWHCGRASHTSFHPDLGLPVAPSAIKINADYIHTPMGKEAYEVPRSLTTEEIKQVVLDYQAASKRAKAADFDGVEIHSANGYLLDEFLQSKTNHRTDIYGGSKENRTRILLEIVDAVRQVWDANKIGVRYTKELAEQRLQAGDADLIAFGRPFISNPDLVTRFHKNLELNAEADMADWYTDNGAKGYIDFPMTTVTV